MEKGTVIHDTVCQRQTTCITKEGQLSQDETNHQGHTGCMHISFPNIGNYQAT